VGHQLELAAVPGLHPALEVVSSPPSAFAILPGATNYAGALALPGGGVARVEISLAASPIAAAHARWIIHDFYNKTPERLVSWQSQAADRGVVPCSTPAGPCPGYLGGMTVLRGQALYDVFVSSGDRGTAWAVVRSFRFVTPALRSRPVPS
jgi:hypothetical protein